MIAATGAAMLLLSGCNKTQEQQSHNRIMATGGGVPANHIAGNAEIETLPVDESSTTPTNQLQNGYDNPDVNDLATSNSQTSNSQ